MLTEVDVNNPDGTLRPGLYVNVSFAIPRQHPGVVVPDEALVFNAQGLHVVTVGADEHVHFQPVSIYRDFGTTAELSEGLQGSELLVLQPPADIQEGSTVRVGPPPNPPNGTERTARR
jgi:multidrug efflux pump subunit AcrA (membrane-fusion protein)